MFNVKFSDGTNINVSSDEPIHFILKSEIQHVDLEKHHNLGPIPSFIALMSEYEYFSLSSEFDVVYNCNQIVSISRLP